uniref:hypothetical protein n=1 Tax=Anaerobutyricum hallii TaxID=39488 RepID=UPI003FF0BB48
WEEYTYEAAAHVIFKNASFRCAQTAQPQFELALRRIFTYYWGCGFCVFQSYKSVEKIWGWGQEK